MKVRLLIVILILLLITLTIPVGAEEGSQCPSVRDSCADGARAFYDVCMASTLFTESYCSRQKSQFYVNCVTGNGCSLGCIDFRTGVVLPCPGEQ